MCPDPDCCPPFYFTKLILTIHYIEVASWTPRQSDKPPGWVGIPRFHGSGSTVVQGQKLRLVIIVKLKFRSRARNSGELFLSSSKAFQGQV